MRVQGAKRPCRGLGCPQKPLVPLLLAAAGGEQGEKKMCGDTPRPGKGPQPFAIPPLKAIEGCRTDVQKIRGESWRHVPCALTHKFPKGLIGIVLPIRGSDDVVA